MVTFHLEVKNYNLHPHTLTPYWHQTIMNECCDISINHEECLFLCVWGKYDIKLLLTHHTDTHTHYLQHLLCQSQSTDDDIMTKAHMSSILLNMDECVSFMTHADRIPCGPFVSHSMWHHLTLQCDMVESHHATDALLTACHSHSKKTKYWTIQKEAE